MPKIYDNKNTSFLSGLKDALEISYRSDICTAYFNLRGWKKIANFIDKYNGEDNHQCRLLLGMYASDYELRRELASQLKDKKVIVKCFTRHPLHAKLYLTFNQKEFAKKVGFLGSSNLTYAGLEKNGELNIDVLDQQSCETLSQWFEEKWQDQFSLDISENIINLIEESWAGDKLLLPYHVYMKMAYHLEKLDGMNEKSEEIRQIIEDIYHYPLSNEAEQTLKRMIRRKISDKEILKLTVEKHRSETLVNKKESKRMDEKPKTVCSMGLLK